MSHFSQVNHQITANGAQILDVREVSIPLERAPRWHLFLMTVKVDEVDSLKANLALLCNTLEIDFVCQTVAERQRRYRLAVFDMDSTLIQCEVIDELAKVAGVGSEVATITQRSMMGELNFDESFRLRLAMLRGLDVRVVEEICDHLPRREGLRDMTKNLKARGLTLAICSGGFLPFARRLQRDYGFDHVFANSLESVDGRLTGNVCPPIVNSDFKARVLRELAARLNLSLSSCIAVGDGANDLAMIKLAGLGIAFHAKQLVNSEASHRILYAGLDSLCYLMDTNDNGGVD